MKITRVLHASVNTAAAEPATSFYEDVLGLEPVWRPDIPGVPGRWFKVGDVQLHLVGLPTSGAGIDPSDHHVCFAVDDLEAAVDELRGRGIETVSAEQDQRGRTVAQVFLRDPAGNVIELQQEDGGD
jgi:glyoxylase I family protein